MGKASRKRRRPRGPGGGVGKAESGGLQADHTLTTVIFNIMALPAGSVHIVDDRYMAMTPDALCLIRQMTARLTALGGNGQRHIDNALRMLQQGGRV